MLIGTRKVSPIRNRIDQIDIDKKKVAIKISATLEQLKAVFKLKHFNNRDAITFCRKELK